MAHTVIEVASSTPAILLSLEGVCMRCPVRRRAPDVECGNVLAHVGVGACVRVRVECGCAGKPILVRLPRSLLPSSDRDGE